MDPRLQQAAETGNIDELYALIDENPNILEDIDAVPFINTPFHVAAAFGKLEFAVEMLNLKPSFATKLNTSGYTPLHLAVENNIRTFFPRLLRLDSGFARVKGKNGITPFLLLVIRGRTKIAAQCLMSCPECIQDLSVHGHNALHLAVINDRFEVLQVLTGWIQRMSQKRSITIEGNVVNRIDFTSNTALHLAAYKNDHQAMRLLLECRMVQRNKVNAEEKTFLDILRNHGKRGEGGDLDLEKLVLETGCKEAASIPKSKARFEYLKLPITFRTFCFTGMKRLRSSYSDESRGVYLVVCTLIIATTYQTVLQPPGGVHQSGDANAGSVVMKQTFFILLWMFNTVGFCCAVFYTLCLLSLGNLFTLWFLWIGFTLCSSYALAMGVVSPHPLVFLPVTFTFMLLCALVFFWNIFGVRWWTYLKMPSRPQSGWF